MFKIFLQSFVIFFFSWLILFKIGINSLPIQSEDTVPTMFLPYSILQDGTLYLDKYYDQMIKKYPHPDDKFYTKGLTPFYLKKVEFQNNVHYLTAFPIVTALVSLPIYFFPVLFKIEPSWENLFVISHLSSAFIMALSGVCFYYLLKTYIVFDDQKSKLLTYVYLFGTVNFAMLSQSLWQHGTLQLFIILGLIFVYRFLLNNKLKNIFFSGLFFGIAVLTRPTSALIWPFVFLLLFLSLKKNLILLFKSCSFAFFGLMVNVLSFLIYNNIFYKSINNQGYSSQLFTNWLGGFPESFFGVWLSPSKGILVYSPVFLFSIFGLYLVFKNKLKDAYLYYIYGLIVLFHTLIISFWKHWYGGYSFGYRMSSDIIPFLVLLLVPFVMSTYYLKFKKVFFISLIFSVIVQLFGLVFYDGIWHNAYDKGFVDTKWLWSIKDSEFAFNLRRIFVKIGLLDRACPQCLTHE